MGHLLSRRPSAAMVVAIAALVVAMSGTAVAASSLVSGNSLIKKNSLSGNRLQNRSVMGSKIKLSSLGTVPSANRANTATSATTATTAGSASISKLSYVTAPFTVPGDGTVVTGTATCPTGTDVTGGGGSSNDTSGSEEFQASYPAGKTGWTAAYEDFSGGPSTAYVYAICAPAASTAP
jgi:hypothetical protein